MPVSRPRDFNRRLPSAPSPGVFTARGKPQWIFIDPRQASYGPLVSAVAPPVVRSTFRAHAFPLRWFPCALVLCYSYVSAFLCVCFFFLFFSKEAPSLYTPTPTTTTTSPLSRFFSPYHHWPRNIHRIFLLAVWIKQNDLHISGQVFCVFLATNAEQRDSRFIRKLNFCLKKWASISF